MRRAGKLAAEVLDFITPHVIPGVTTAELDQLCHNYLILGIKIDILVKQKIYKNGGKKSMIGKKLNV